jgi:hypothetical protein
MINRKHTESHSARCSPTGDLDRHDVVRTLGPFQTCRSQNLNRQPLPDSVPKVEIQIASDAVSSRVDCGATFAKYLPVRHASSSTRLAAYNPAILGHRQIRNRPQVQLGQRHRSIFTAFTCRHGTGCQALVRVTTMFGASRIGLVKLSLCWNIPTSTNPRVGDVGYTTILPKGQSLLNQSVGNAHLLRAQVARGMSWPHD